MYTSLRIPSRQRAGGAGRGFSASVGSVRPINPPAHATVRPDERGNRQVGHRLGMPRAGKLDGQTGRRLGSDIYSKNASGRPMRPSAHVSRGTTASRACDQNPKLRRPLARSFPGILNAVSACRASHSSRSRGCGGGQSGCSWRRGRG